MHPALLAIGTTALCPEPGPNPDVRVSVLNTGWIETVSTRISHGNHKHPFRIPLLVGHIHHPDGDVYVDAGLGNTTRTDRFPRFPLSTHNATIPSGSTLAEQANTPPTTILMTHLHYDHTGGLLDLTHDTEVWVSSEEWNTARTSNVAFPQARMREAVRWHSVDFGAGSATQRLGRPAIDVKGDGSIWYLSTPGHTPGSASVLVHAHDQPWLFIGDIAWVDEHLDDKNRPKWVSAIVDGRPKQQKDALDWARYLKSNCPSLQIVAGHEPRWAKP